MDKTKVEDTEQVFLQTPVQALSYQTLKRMDVDAKMSVQGCKSTIQYRFTRITQGIDLMSIMYSTTNIEIISF